MMPLATPLAASVFLLAPSIKLIYADDPSPNISAKAANTMVMGKMMFVAPLPRYPTPQPIKIWSTML